jgi:hypothetical protein
MSRNRHPKAAERKDIPKDQPMLKAWLEQHPTATIEDFDKYVMSLKDKLLVAVDGKIQTFNIKRR